MNPNIVKMPFPEIKGAYLVFSARRRADDPKWGIQGNGIVKNVSFFFDGGNGKGVEWEPEFGPITRITSCAETDEGAQPHWFYPFYLGQGNWSQCGVLENGLPEMLLAGSYAGLFAELERWL